VRDGLAEKAINNKSQRIDCICLAFKYFMPVAVEWNASLILQRFSPSQLALTD